MEIRRSLSLLQRVSTVYRRCQSIVGTCIFLNSDRKTPKFCLSIFVVVIYSKYLIHTSAHTLARSLHDVSCANNNRFAVVVCFRLAFHASGMRIFFENFRV